MAIMTAAGPWGASDPVKAPTINPLIASLIGLAGNTLDPAGYVFDAATGTWKPAGSVTPAPTAPTSNPAGRNATAPVAPPVAPSDPGAMIRDPGNVVAPLMTQPTGDPALWNMGYGPNNPANSAARPVASTGSPPLVANPAARASTPAVKLEPTPSTTMQPYPTNQGGQIDWQGLMDWLRGGRGALSNAPSALPPTDTPSRSRDNQMALDRARQQRMSKPSRTAAYERGFNNSTFGTGRSWLGADRYEHGGRVRERPQAPLTLGENGDVGPAIYVKREEQQIYDVMPAHKSLMTDTSEGNMFMEGGEHFAMGGRAKKTQGRASGDSALVKGYADGGRSGNFPTRRFDPAWIANPRGSAAALPVGQQFWSGGQGTTALPYFDWMDAYQRGPAFEAGSESGGMVANPDYERAAEIYRRFQQKYPGHMLVGNDEFVRGQNWGQQAGEVNGYYFIDPNSVTYDPEFGFVTPESNYRPERATDTLGTYGPWALAAIPALATLAPHLFGAEAFGAEALGTGAFDIGGSAGFGGTVPLGGEALGVGALDFSLMPNLAPSGTLPEFMEIPSFAGTGAPIDFSQYMLDPLAHDPGLFTTELPMMESFTPEMLDLPTYQQVAANANPSLWQQIQSGARSAGQSISSFLRANPTLARLGLSLVASALSSGSGSGSGSSVSRQPGGGINRTGDGTTPVSTTARGTYGTSPALGNRQQGILDLQEQIAREQYDTWKNEFLPTVRKYIAETDKMGSPEEIERAQSRAIGDVATTFGSARGQAQRNLERYGMGSKTAAALGDFAIKEGAARAGAANVAADRERERGFDARARLAAMAAGIPGTAASIAGSAAGNAANMDAGARGWATLDTQREQQEADRALRRELGLADIDMRGRSLDHSIDNSNWQRRRTNLSDAGRLVGGVGDFFRWLGDGSSSSASALADNFGVFADGGRIIDGEYEAVADAAGGGEVRGPGTTTSDSVPARLSKGEFVLNAQSVKLIDEVAPGLLDKVNDLGLEHRVMAEMGV